MEIFENFIQFVIRLAALVSQVVIRYQLYIFWLGILAVLILFVRLFRDIWLFHRRSVYKNLNDWTLLEIKIPREVQRTPKAMEQFFMNLHGLRNAPGDFMETYIEGEVTLWWSLELVSFGGKVHFYIRTPKKHKKMVEAGLYAQYPNVEVVEVADYISELPATTKEAYLKNENIFGSEFRLAKEDAYPITTYEEFELTKEELAIDPISALIEVLANIHKEETVCIQILIRPADDEWRKAAKALVDKLIGREAAKKAKKKLGVDEWTRNLILAPIEYPIWAEKEKPKKEEGKEFSLFKLTPGEQLLIKALENNISKPGFETTIRFLYLAPNSIFSTNFARKGILGAFNQYASPSLNSFKNNKQVETRTRWVYFPWIFVKQRVEARKQRLLHNFRERKMPEETSFGKFFTSHPLNFNNKSGVFILTATELATIFHVPSEVVLTAPHIKRAESKRMGPPAGLPIFEEEE